MTDIQTNRLTLRSWTQQDVDDLRRMKMDPDIMRHEPGGAITADEAQAITVDEQQSSWELLGYGPFAVELTDGHAFIGSVGVTFPGHWPHPEMSWIFDRKYWGHGYATEAAVAIRDFAFEHSAIDELISNCLPENTTSERIMQKLGMTNTSVDRCVLRHIPVKQYTLRKADWELRSLKSTAS